MKRILSLILAVLMIASCFPIAIFAETISNEETKTKLGVNIDESFKVIATCLPAYLCNDTVDDCISLGYKTASNVVEQYNDSPSILAALGFGIQILWDDLWGNLPPDKDKLLENTVCVVQEIQQNQTVVAETWSEIKQNYKNFNEIYGNTTEASKKLLSEKLAKSSKTKMSSDEVEELFDKAMGSGSFETLETIFDVTGKAVDAVDFMVYAFQLYDLNAEIIYKIMDNIPNDSKLYEGLSLLLDEINKSPEEFIWDNFLKPQIADEIIKAMNTVAVEYIKSATGGGEIVEALLEKGISILTDLFQDILDKEVYSVLTIYTLYDFVLTLNSSMLQKRIDILDCYNNGAMISQTHLSDYNFFWDAFVGAYKHYLLKSAELDKTGYYKSSLKLAASIDLSFPNYIKKCSEAVYNDVTTGNIICSHWTEYCTATSSSSKTYYCPICETKRTVKISYTSPSKLTQSQVQSRINELTNLLKGKYFTTNQTACTDASGDACSIKNIANAAWFKTMFGVESLDTVNQLPVQHNGSYWMGTAGWSCYGFARFAHWYIFKTSNTDKVSTKLVKANVPFDNSTMQTYAMPGDSIRIQKEDGSSSHSVIYIGCDSNGIKVIDGNWDKKCGVSVHYISESASPKWYGSNCTIVRATNYDESGSGGGTVATYTISYDACGGTGAPASQTKKYGTAITLSTTIPTLTGYTFKGWATSPVTSVAYAPGATFTANTNTKLYAVWEMTPQFGFVDSMARRINSILVNLDGKYFTYSGTASCTTNGWCTDSDNCCLNQDVMSSTWFKNLFGSITTFPTGTEYNHYSPKDSKGAPSLEQFASGQKGFATFAFWYIFGYNQKTPTPFGMEYIVTTAEDSSVKFDKATIQKYAKPGDIIRFTKADGTGSFTSIFLGCRDDHITLLDSNWNNSKCKVSVHDIYFTDATWIGGKIAITRASNYDEVFNSIQSDPEYKTQYKYHRYNITNGNPKVCGGASDRTFDETGWIDTRIPVDTSNFNYYFHGRVESCSTYGCTDVTTEYMYRHSGNDEWPGNWFYEEVRFVPVEKYVVTFNANGGTTITESKTVTQGMIYGMLPTPTRVGYTFTGWYTALAGGTKITNASEVLITEDQTLYAHWKANTYTISFNANGGTGTPVSQVKTHGVTISLSGTKPTRTGYAFQGWATSSTGTVVYSAGAGFEENANMTLYAVWKANTYKITFDANGGTVSQASKDVIFGNKYGTLPTPTRAHYTFDGWYTSPTGGAKATSETTMSTVGSRTLYAHWKANTYTISFNANGGTGAPAAQVKTHDVTLTLSTTRPTRSGYTFQGWSTSASGTVVYSPGASFTSNANTTLYAVWKSNTVSVTGVSLNKTSATLNVGDTLTLTATVTPSNATNKAVTWTSSDTSVATISSSGVVTALKAGTTTITVTTVDGSKTATCVVTVNEATIVDADVIYTIGSASSKPGSTIELALSVSSDVTVNGLLLDNLNYDKNALEFVEFAEYGDLITTSALGTNGVDSAKGEIALGYTDAVKPNGEICVLRFFIKETAMDGEYAINIDGAASANGQKLPSKVNGGKITISKWVSGDFDSDEKLDMKDVVYFMNWINFSWTGKYPMVYDGDKDFNKDGNVDMKDVVYFMNWVNFSWTGNYDINW